MDIIELIRMAGSAQQVLAIVSGFIASIGDAHVLPGWWVNAPLTTPQLAEQRLLELLDILNRASQQWDHERCAAAKRVLHVLATGVWKLKGY